jgi:hypothetical protein
MNTIKYPVYQFGNVTYYIYPKAEWYSVDIFIDDKFVESTYMPR